LDIAIPTRFPHQQRDRSRTLTEPPIMSSY
jgi:hypothetical protein